MSLVPTPRRRLAYLIPEHLPKTDLATTCFQAITYSNAVKIGRISRAVWGRCGLVNSRFLDELRLTVGRIVNSIDAAEVTQIEER